MQKKKKSTKSKISKLYISTGSALLCVFLLPQALAQVLGCLTKAVSRELGMLPAGSLKMLGNNSSSFPKVR